MQIEFNVGKSNSSHKIDLNIVFNQLTADLLMQQDSNFCFRESRKFVKFDLLLHQIDVT